MSTKAKTKGAEQATAFAMNAEMPKDARELAEKTVDQAQAAFDKAGDMAHSNVQMFDASANALKNSSAELQLKALEFAQANMSSMFELTRSMLGADKPETVFEASKKFSTEMGQTMMSQATELNTLAVKLTQDAVQPLKDSVEKSATEYRKTFSV